MLKSIYYAKFVKILYERNTDEFYTLIRQSFNINSEILIVRQKRRTNFQLWKIFTTLS